MSERSDLVRHWMKPAQRDQIIKLVHALVPVMKQRNWDERTAKAILETYAFDLAEQPYFAIDDACTAFRRGFVGDGWMPTPGELLQEALRKREWLQKEGYEIARILNATVCEESPGGERKINRDRVDALLSELRAARPINERARERFAPKEPVKADVSPEERLAETAKRYRENPVRIDPALARVAA